MYREFLLELQKLWTNSVSKIVFYYDQSKHQFCLYASTVSSADFMQNMKEGMQYCLPVPTSSYNVLSPFIHPALFSVCIPQVILRTDGKKTPLTPPYDCPFKVICRTQKHFSISVNGKNCDIIVDLFKQPSLLSDYSSTNVPFLPMPSQFVDPDNSCTVPPASSPPQPVQYPDPSPDDTSALPRQTRCIQAVGFPASYM